MDHGERHFAEGDFSPSVDFYPNQFAPPQGNGACSYGTTPMASSAQQWGDEYYTPQYTYSLPISVSEDQIVSPTFASDYDGSLDFFNRFSTANTEFAQSQSMTSSQYWGSDMASPNTVRSPDSLVSPSTSSRHTAAFEQQVARGLAEVQQQPRQTQTSSRNTRSHRSEDLIEKPSTTNKGGKKHTKTASRSEDRPSKKKDQKGKDSKQTTSKSKTKPPSTKVHSLPTPSSTSSSTASKPATRRSRPSKPASPPPSEFEYDDEDDENQPTQRDRNRMAATKCRAKTKAAISKLEDHERVIADRRDVLSAEKALLEAQVLVLRDQVLNHHDADCECDDIRLYVKNASRLIAETGGKHPIWGPDGKGGQWAEYGEDAEYEED